MLSHRNRTKTTGEINPYISSSSIVTIALLSHETKTPLGMLLAPAATSSFSQPDMSKVTIVAGWEPLLYNNKSKLGPIQRTGQVRLGDRLVQINNVDVRDMTFRNVMDLLKSMVYGTNPSLKSLSFAPLSAAPTPRMEELEAAASSSNTSYFLTSLFNNTLSGAKDKFGTTNQQWYTFSSRIKDETRTRRIVHAISDQDIVVNYDEHGKEAWCISAIRNAGTYQTIQGEKKPRTRLRALDEEFVEYEVECLLTAKYSNSGLGVVGSSLFRIGEEGEERKWSIWKRYSEFKELDEKLRRSFGWQMDTLNDGWGLAFPRAHVLSTIFSGVLNPSFVDRRREELSRYWRTLHDIDEMFDFSDPTSHRFSKDLAAFLDVESQFYRNRLTGALAIDGSSNASSAGYKRRNSATNASKFDASLAGGNFYDEESLSAMSTTQLSMTGNNSVDDSSTLLIRDGDMREIVVDTDQNVSSTSGSVLNSGGSGRRKKRTHGVAKPAFQRSLMDTL